MRALHTTVMQSDLIVFGGRQDGLHLKRQAIQCVETIHFQITCMGRKRKLERGEAPHTHRTVV